MPKTSLKSQKKVNFQIGFLLALASVMLGIYFLHSMLAARGDLSDAAREAGYTPPPIASVQSGDSAVIDSKSQFSMLAIFVTAMFIAIPVAGGAIYWLRAAQSRK